jgi:hypothetical protein
MERLGVLFNSDKVTHHKYHEIYPMFINKFINNVGGMIEIGVATLASVNMWINLFPNLYVYGFDINTDEHGQQFKIFKGDQSKETDLDNFIKTIDKPIYFINDDGSHIPEHQLLTFNKLFPLLEQGGIYIIEDIETSYWTKSEIYNYPTKYGYKNPNSAVELFKNIIDCVNSEFLQQNIDTPIMHLDNIKMISFAYNCIIIEKGTREKRPYRYQYKI